MNKQLPPELVPPVQSDRDQSIAAAQAELETLRHGGAWVLLYQMPDDAGTGILSVARAGDMHDLLVGGLAGLRLAARQYGHHQALPMLDAALAILGANSEARIDGGLRRMEDDGK